MERSDTIILGTLAHFSHYRHFGYLGHFSSFIINDDAVKSLQRPY
jgi:hypothetical protein